jgi:transcriptional regulator with XRE-family HTH domain
MRVALDLSQDELAVKLGVAGSTIGYWESGEVTPHKRTRERVRALGVAASSDLAAKRNRRYSSETISALHQALDIIIDGAPSAVIQKVSEFLDEFAGRYGIPSERGGRERVLDTSGIISEVLNAAPASSLASANKMADPGRQAELGKEARNRVHPGKKKKQSNPSKIA